MPYVKKNQKMARRVNKKKNLRRKDKVSNNVKKFVKRLLNQRLENKICANVSQSTTSIVPMGPVNFNAINLSNIWTISQGTGQANRIGNSIHPKGWRLKGYFSVPFGVAVSAPVIIKMYIFKQKSSYILNSAGASNFYQNGNANIAPAGTFSDQLRQVNSDVYTLYTTRVFKVGTAGVVSTTTGTANNDFKNICPFNINLLKYQKSKFKYSDTTNAPTNSGLYMAYTACFADGTAIGTSSAPSITFEIEGSFEDA